jgi:uncharacterized protein
MHYIIHCLDRPGAGAGRLANYDAHKAYLAAAPVRILVSGPLLAPDNETMIGSAFLVESDTREAVERFNGEDPFNRAGVWGEIRIHPFLKRMDNR